MMQLLHVVLTILTAIASLSYVRLPHGHCTVDHQSLSELALVTVLPCLHCCMFGQLDESFLPDWNRVANKANPTALCVSHDLSD